MRYGTCCTTSHANSKKNCYCFIRLSDIQFRSIIMINSVKFSGYKSFPSNTDYEIDLTPSVTVFIGKNNCGKSSCIDAIESALMHNQYINTHHFLKELSVSFVLSNNDIEAQFSKNQYNSYGISGRLYDYGRKFIDQKIYASLMSEYNSILKTNELKLRLHDNQPFIDLSKAKVLWDNIIQKHKISLSKTDFRRINADRDIIPEEESPNETVQHNGLGTTNLLRKFINHSEYDEKIVENVLLSELNRIMSPDSHFKSIKLQQIQDDEKLLWEIFLEEDDGRRFALSKSGSGLKTIILMLVNLYVIPQTKEYKDRHLYFAFEELENNLHPALQRKVFEYIYQYAKETGHHIFITTHSHIAINTYFDKNDTIIYHVQKTENASKLIKVDNHSERMDILNDLDVHASDLFQANGIIWVEGPSDRIYINKWLQIICDSPFIEGSDYQYLFYGGKVLSHYSADQSIQKDLISILTTNQNAAIVIDSDRRDPNSKISRTKSRIRDEFSKINAFCWITQGKEIENYLPSVAINKKYSSNLSDIRQFELFPDYISRIVPNFTNQKVSFAKSISEFITKENSCEILDLEKQIRKLYAAIKKWNHRE